MQAAIAAGNGTVVMCQIESRAGCEAAREIAEVDGVSGLFVAAPIWLCRSGLPAPARPT